MLSYIWYIWLLLFCEVMNKNKYQISINSWPRPPQPVQMLILIFTSVFLTKTKCPVKMWTDTTCLIKCWIFNNLFPSYMFGFYIKWLLINHHQLTFLGCFWFRCFLNFCLGPGGLVGPQLAGTRRMNPSLLFLKSRWICSGLVWTVTFFNFPLMCSWTAERQTFTGNWTFLMLKHRTTNDNR